MILFASTPFGAVAIRLFDLGVGAPAGALVLRPPQVAGAGGAVHGPLHQPEIRGPGSTRPVAPPNVLAIRGHFVVEGMEDLRTERKEPCVTVPLWLWGGGGSSTPASLLPHAVSFYNANERMA